MQLSGPDEFYAAASQAAGDSELNRKLENASARHFEHLAVAKNEFLPYERERDVARRIKEESIERLAELLGELKSKLEARGVKVFFAEDAAQARDYILKVARDAGVKRVVKGKSMTTEEIKLNPCLEEAGIEAVETDLGEYIVQLRNEPPSHIITPAIHLSKEDIGHLFAEKLGMEYTSDPPALTAVARERLRDKFLSAEMGITGVNFAVAETGTLVVVENEGNGRFCSTSPDIFVALMGIEKVIPRFEDLSHFLEILARTATGQRLTAYTSFLNGPRSAADPDGPREMHLVILDNGRTRMLADPVLREALYCLRCGACLNACPVYRHIGGHAYKSAYPGPIGAIISPIFIWHRSSRPFAFCVHLVWCLQGRLPGQDRYPAYPAASALENQRRRRRKSGMARGAGAGEGRRRMVRAGGKVSVDGPDCRARRRVYLETIRP